jgi:hypothetical protein
MMESARGGGGASATGVLGVPSLVGSAGTGLLGTDGCVKANTMKEVDAHSSACQSDGKEFISVSPTLVFAGERPRRDGPEREEVGREPRPKGGGGERERE